MNSEQDPDKPDVPVMTGKRNHTVFPCGCEYALGETADGDAFLFQPCRPSCMVWQYVQELQAESQKPESWTLGTIDQVVGSGRTEG